MFAASHGSAELVRLLLDRGADVDARNGTGRTALHYAVFRDRPEAAKVLLERGARVDVATRIDGFGRVSPLMLAAGRGRRELTELLLAHGADVDQMSDVEPFGQATPLMLAARRGFREIVLLLLAAGADPGVSRRDGATASSWAREEGHDEIVALLEGDEP